MAGLLCWPGLIMLERVAIDLNRSAVLINRVNPLYIK